eukprot:SAG22_NODE_8480_length_652_cov_1.721519_1_plen_68_part_10
MMAGQSGAEQSRDAEHRIKALQAEREAVRRERASLRRLRGLNSSRLPGAGAAAAAAAAGGGRPGPLRA